MSPVTDLAFNLCDTSLSSPNTPQMIIKKKLTMDDESSPSPSTSHCSSDSGTPLTTITNKPKGRFGARSITRCPTEPNDLEANKENIPLTQLISSPCKMADSPSNLKDRKSFNRMIQSPEKEKTKTLSQKRPLFTVLEDENSKDSGYSSQPLEEDRHRKKSRCDAENSLEDILADCSPSKEGLTVLQRSPCSKQTSKASSDGFDVESLDSLAEMPEEEDEEDSSYTNSFSALLKKEILSSSTEKNSLVRRSSCNSSPSPSGQRSIRRALSMIDKPSSLEDERSPLSRNEFKAGFKRPEAPCVSTNIPTFGRKKRCASFQIYYGSLKCNPWSGIPHLGRGVSAYSSRISHTLGRLSWEVNLRLLLKNPLNSRTIMMIFYPTAMGELSRHCVFPAVHCFTRISFQKILLAIGNRIVEKPPQPSFHHMSHPGRPHCWQTQRDCQLIQVKLYWIWILYI